MEKKYLLDSNICIHLLRGNESVRNAIAEVGWDSCYISELTVVELYYGAECSIQKEKNIAEVDAFVSDLHVIPLSTHIREFCRQKALMRKSGTMIEDFDLFIGTAAKVAGCVLVTENVRHLSHIENIEIENWVKR